MYKSSARLETIVVTHPRSYVSFLGSTFTREFNFIKYTPVEIY